MNVLITGGTGIIGRQLIEAMAEAGHEVWFTSRSLISITEVESCIVKSVENSKVTGICVDLSSTSYEKELLPKLPSKLHAVIHAMRDTNNLKASGGIVSRADFSAEFLMNVIIPYELTMLLVQKFDQLKAVINIGSQYGSVVPPPSLYESYDDQSFIHYGVSKSALIPLTKELAVRLANQDIAVNCVSYGGVEGRADFEFTKRYAQFCPQNRMLKKEELAEMVLLLLNQSSLAITGQNLQIDGGWTLC